MKTTSVAICLLSVCINMASAQTPAARDTAALFREVEALNRGMEAAMNRGDPKSAAAFYADNAVVRTPRAVTVRGRAEIDRYFAQIGKATWKLDVIQVGGDPDAPFQVGRSTLIHGTRPDTSIVNFLVYWRRQPNGQLKIELDYYH